MAPFYFGLVVILAVLLYKFVELLIGSSSCTRPTQGSRHHPRRAQPD